VRFPTSVRSALAACAALACSEETSERALPAGDAERGREVIVAYVRWVEDLPD
jgi:hypothetical protein